MTLPSGLRSTSAIRRTLLARVTALASSCLILGGFSSVAWAQASSEQLREVAQQALASNPQVQSAYHGFLGAEHQVEAARGGYLPSIDVSAGIGRESSEGDGRGSIDSDFAEISLNQMIYDGFATRSEVERLDRVKLVSYYELLDASEEVTLEVIQAYQDMRRYRELVELARENYTKHLEVFEQTEQRVMAGAGRRVDLEQISGRLALAESNLITEASNLHDVSARYQRLVGALPAEVLAPAPSFEGKLPASVNDAVQLAYEGNPGFHAAIENIAAASAERDGTRSAFQPRLDFRATAGTNNLDDVTGRRDSQSVELVASMNLYRGGSDLASFRRASDLLEQASSQRDLECTNVRQTTQIAYNDTRRLREQLRHLNQHRQSIDRVRGAYQQQFDIGQRTLLDVLDSENEYFEASRAYVNAQYDVTIADAQTLAAMGRLMPTLGLVSDQIPNLAELSSEGVSLDSQDLCPVQSPTAQNLNDLIGDISISVEPYAPSDNSSEAGAAIPSQR